MSPLGSWTPGAHHKSAPVCSQGSKSHDDMGLTKLRTETAEVTSSTARNVAPVPDGVGSSHVPGSPHLRPPRAHVCALRVSPYVRVCQSARTRLRGRRGDGGGKRGRCYHRAPRWDWGSWGPAGEDLGPPTTVYRLPPRGPPSPPRRVVPPRPPTVFLVPVGRPPPTDSDARPAPGPHRPSSSASVSQTVRLSLCLWPLTVGAPVRPGRPAPPASGPSPPPPPRALARREGRDARREGRRPARRPRPGRLRRRRRCGLGA